MTAIREATGILWDFHTTVPDNALSKVDAVIVLGSYDESVAACAAELFFRHDPDVLLFTGDRGNWTQGLFETTEAEHFAGIARNLGVPADRMIVEPCATNIGENIRFAEARLPSLELGALFVTKPQTQRRLLATLDGLSRVRRYAVAAPRRTLDEAVREFGDERIFTEMVGDLDRILHYPHRGFSAAISVPSAVLDAWRSLQAAGFDSHMLTKPEG